VGTPNICERGTWAESGKSGGHEIFCCTAGFWLLLLLSPLEKVTMKKFFSGADPVAAKC
jgi:hypothetical protein